MKEWVLSKLKSDTGWMSISAAAQQVAGLALSVLLARILDGEKLGMYALAQATVATAGAVFGTGIGLSATKLIAEQAGRGNARLWPYAAAPLVLGTSLAFFGSCVILVFAEPLATHVLRRADLTPHLAMVSPLLCFNAVNMVQVGMLSGVKHFRTIAQNNLTFSPFRIALVAGGAMWASVEGALLALVVAQGAQVLTLERRVAAIKEFTPELGSPRRITAAEVIKVLRFAVPGVLSNAVVGPANYICYALLVRQESGFMQMAAISLTSQWQGAIKFFPTRLLEVSMPSLSTRYVEVTGIEFRRQCAKHFRRVSAIAFLPVLPIALLSGWIMRLYGADYVQFSVVLTLMAGCAALQMSARTLTQSLLASDRPMHEFTFNAVRVMVLLSLWWFWQSLGAYGLAWATACSYLWMVASLLAFQRRPLRP